MGWVNPRVGLGWIGLGRVFFNLSWLGWVGSNVEFPNNLVQTLKNLKKLSSYSIVVVLYL